MENKHEQVRFPGLLTSTSCRPLNFSREETGRNCLSFSQAFHRKSWHVKSEMCLETKVPQYLPVKMRDIWIKHASVARYVRDRIRYHWKKDAEEVFLSLPTGSLWHVKLVQTPRLTRGAEVLMVGWMIAAAQYFMVATKRREPTNVDPRTLITLHEKFANPGRWSLDHY